MIAKKYDGSKKRSKVGRPLITDEIIALVVKFKDENSRCGYHRITDQIIYVGFQISKSSVKNIMIENGMACSAIGFALGARQITVMI